MLANTELNITLYSTTKKPEEESEVTQDVPKTANTGILTLNESNAASGNSQSLPLTGVSVVLFLISLLISVVFALLVSKYNKKTNTQCPSKYSLKRGKFKKYQFLSTSLASLTLVASVISLSSALQKNEPAVFETSEMIAVSAGILDTDYIAAVHTIVSVPATKDGFKLYISSHSAALVDINDKNNSIPSIKEAGQLSDNSFGIYVGESAPTSSSDFQPISSDENGRFYIYSSNSSEAQTIHLWYGVRAKSAKPSTYAISLSIEYLEINPADIGIKYLHEMTPEICQKMEIGRTNFYYLEDIRDGKLYHIGRMNDGNCWMTENLDLDLDPDVALDSQYSNLPEGYSWNPSYKTGEFRTWTYEDCEKTEQACSDLSYSSSYNEDDFGNYYNIFAASAGTVKVIAQAGNQGSEENIETDDSGTEEGIDDLTKEAVEKVFPNDFTFTTATASICPKGWHMASTDNFQRLFLTYGLDIFKFGENSISIEMMEDYSGRIPGFSDTFGGIYSQFLFDAEGGDNDESEGYRIPTLTRDVIGGGISLAYYQTQPYIFYVAKAPELEGSAMYEAFAYDEPEDADWTFGPLEGASVRCVMDYNMTTITYNKNTGDEVKNLPAEESYPVDKNSPKITLSNIVPEREGYIFAGWSIRKERDETLYYQGDTITQYASNITLYATWLKEIKVDGVVYDTLQSLTPDACAALLPAEEENDSVNIYGLRDSRDKNVYRVAKLRDGKCWMTQNLALGDASEIILTKDDTDIQGEWRLPASEIEAHGIFNVPNDSTLRLLSSKVFNHGTSVFGNFYTWTAATAQNSPENISEENALNSICPSGWKLPTADGDFAQIIEGYDDVYNTKTPSIKKHIIVDDILFFKPSGGLNKEGFTNGASTNIWSSSAISGIAETLDYKYNTKFKDNDSEYIAEITRKNKSFGAHVRCTMAPSQVVHSEPQINSQTSSVRPAAPTPAPIANEGPLEELQENIIEDETPEEKTQPLGVVQEIKHHEERNDSLILVILIGIDIVIHTVGAILFFKRKRLNKQQNLYSNT